MTDEWWWWSLENVKKLYKCDEKILVGPTRLVKHSSLITTAVLSHKNKLY